MKIQINQDRGATLYNEENVNMELGERVEDLTISFGEDFNGITIKLSHNEVQKLRELLLKGDY